MGNKIGIQNLKKRFEFKRERTRMDILQLGALLDIIAPSNSFRNNQRWFHFRSMTIEFDQLFLDTFSSKLHRKTWNKPFKSCFRHSKKCQNFVSSFFNFSHRYTKLCILNWKNYLEPLQGPPRNVTLALKRVLEKP